MCALLLTFTARWALKHLYIGLALWPGPLLALCAGATFLLVRDMEGRSNRMISTGVSGGSGGGRGAPLPPRPSSVASVTNAYAARTESSKEE